MEPREQLLAIAKACGWEAFANQGSAGGFLAHDHELNTDWDVVGGTPEQAILKQCPDYLNDLDAIRKAVRGASFGLTRCERYEEELKAIVHRDFKARESDPETRVAELFIWHADASQHSEAFLRTLDLWNPQP